MSADTPLGQSEVRVKRPAGLWVVMTTAPHANGEFVELEDESGCGVGESSGVRWRQEGDYWLLGPFPKHSLESFYLREALQDVDPVLLADIDTQLADLEPSDTAGGAA